MKNREKVRSLFISDIHLGSQFCRAEELLQFLRGIEAENVYLVGDIIDGWKMQKNIFWSDTYSFIVKRFIGMIKHGTNVWYVTGNHDEFLRKFAPQEFGHVQVVDECVYATVDGRRLLVIHGDIFDQLTMKAKWLYFFGDWAYSAGMWLNSKYNKIRVGLGLKYWSLSLILKRNIKKAVNFINDFEHFIVRYTKEKGCSGVICGHIHTPVIKTVEDVVYYNCGDWVESCSVLIEHCDGQFELRILGEH